MSAAPAKGKVIVTGIAFWFPLGGVTYQFLHYLLGLRRLGYDAYYVEDSGRWVYDPRINDISGDASGNVAAVAPMLEAHGFADRWAYRGPEGRWYGMDGDEVKKLYREADALLNVTAAQELSEDQMECSRRIYIESDPFPAQVRAEQGDPKTLAMLDAHDTHFSFGENLHGEDCTLPTAGYTWLPTRQPVAVDLWRAGPANGSPWTTITTWHNKGKDIEYAGETWYWTKDREFKKHLDLPARTGARFELAVGDDEDARELLERHGWTRSNSLEISADVDSYRTYIQRSRGEFTVARDQYTRPRTGWFSDRSVCYLASGRPVITEETGFSRFLPTGEGLFAFSTTDEAATAIQEVESDYERHCKAALEIAYEHLDAHKVVGSLLERAGL
jgi:hypothetical protein